ncbi:MAG: carboxylating nicotinate-nucleotide diphosphorylase [Parvicellaceae bacterium]
MTIKEFVQLAIAEDIKEGDHSALACIPKEATGNAQLLVKENGILAGVEISKQIFHEFDPSFEFKLLIKDGEKVNKGDIAFKVYGPSVILLSAERLVLNVMQRMSAIATLTNKYVQELKGLKTKVLDTRKTTPLIRFLEKEAVRIGGGVNHRHGLYDMIMLKDNHNDFSGGIEKSINKSIQYLKKNNLNLKIEIEIRNLDEVKEVLKVGNIDRIMLDNFNYEDLRKAIELIDGEYETEASGGINLNTVRNYAECGVDFVSVGALTHSVSNMDLSLKAIS